MRQVPFLFWCKLFRILCRDGRYLATAGQDGIVCLWEVLDRKELSNDAMATLQQLQLQQLQLQERGKQESLGAVSDKTSNSAKSGQSQQQQQGGKGAGGSSRPSSRQQLPVGSPITPDRSIQSDGGRRGAGAIDSQRDLSAFPGLDSASASAGAYRPSMGAMSVASSRPESPRSGVTSGGMSSDGYLSGSARKRSGSSSRGEPPGSRLPRLPVLGETPVRMYRGHTKDVLDLCWSKSKGSDFLLSASMVGR